MVICAYLDKMSGKVKIVGRKYGDALFLENGWFERKSKVPKGTKRGKIKGFTHQSMKRFCDLLVKIDHEKTIDKWGTAKWITLTFDGEETGVERAKEYLDYLLSKVLPRAGYNGPKIWKAELQKRGTIHFHILLFGGDDGLDNLVATRWHKITKSKQAAHLEHGTDCSTVENVKMLRCYLAKYLTKETGESSKWKEGRVWGVYQKSGLVMHQETTVEWDLSLIAVLRSAKKMGIQIPSKIYDLQEYVEYVDEMFSRNREARITYYRWRKEQKEKRSKATAN